MLEDFEFFSHSPALVSLITCHIQNIPVFHVHAHAHVQALVHAYVHAHVHVHYESTKVNRHCSIFDRYCCSSQKLCSQIGTKKPVHENFKIEICWCQEKTFSQPLCSMLKSMLTSMLTSMPMLRSRLTSMLTYMPMPTSMLTFKPAKK